MEKLMLPGLGLFNRIISIARRDGITAYMSLLVARDPP
jgi:hypothetical protein